MKRILSPLLTLAVFLLWCPLVTLAQGKASRAQGEPAAAASQEKTMDVQKKDGTTARTRLAELKQISFLAADAGDQGLLIRTLGGDVATVLFEANPVVTVAGGKLCVRSDSADALELELTDIAEILFGQADATAISQPKSFALVVQDGSALLRNIPDGVTPRVYTLDGRSIPTPAIRGRELRLSRSALGKGVFIVKVGTFSTQIKL